MPQPSCKTRLSIPGKVFILGEYGILAGLPAIVGCVSPRFELRVLETEGGKFPFNPASPAGRLLAALHAQGKEMGNFSFQDPHYGHGGFGASTAQFALLHHAAIPSSREFAEAWLLYRNLAQGEPLPPSGADLIAQWQGGIGVVQPDPNPSVAPTWRDVRETLDWSHLLVFSATGLPGRKIATHQHLAELAARGFPTDGAFLTLISRLKEIVLSGITALDHSRPAAFGATLLAFAREMQEAGLELPATTQDRQAIANIPGVLGVKGAGAMQADALLVWIDGPQSRDSVIQAAQDRGLELLPQELGSERGIRWEN